MLSIIPQNLSSNINSSFNLSFLVNMGAARWFSGQDKINISTLNSNFKTKIPKSQIFEISSMVFNISKHKKEILSKYKCFFDEESNTLTLVINEEISFAEFTKEIMMNLFTFAKKVKIDTICFLLSKKNQQYGRIFQDLMIVGFKPNEKQKEVNIEGNAYKVLEIAANSDEEIEEFFF